MKPIPGICGCYPELAKEHQIKLLDLYAAESLQPVPGYYEELIRADGIHPNDEGHRRIAQELINYLKEF